MARHVFAQIPPGTVDGARYRLGGVSPCSGPLLFARAPGPGTRALLHRAMRRLRPRIATTSQSVAHRATGTAQRVGQTRPSPQRIKLLLRLNRPLPPAIVLAPAPIESHRFYGRATRQASRPRAVIYLPAATSPVRLKRLVAVTRLCRRRASCQRLHGGSNRATPRTGVGDRCWAAPRRSFAVILPTTPVSTTPLTTPAINATSAESRSLGQTMMT